MSQDITTKLGYITFVKRGKYNAATSYKKPDAVSFNGGYYICKSKTAITGIDPTNTTNWDLFAAGVKNIEKTGTDSDDPFTDIYTMYNSEGNSIGTFSVKNGETGTIDDEDISENKTWSSEKLNKDYATLSSKTNVSSATLTDSADGNIAQIKMYGSARKSKNIFNATNQGGGSLTRNSDGTYTVSGTFSSTGAYSLGTYELPSGKYKLVGCPSGGGSDTYYLDFRTDNGVQITDKGSGSPIVTSSGQSGKECRIVVLAGTYNNIVFKPMIVNADLYPNVTYADYEPYGLIMAKGEVTSTNEDESVSSSISAYDTIGNYLLSVGSDVKDELSVNADGTGVRTPRFGLLDLGTVTWSASGVQSDGTYRYNGTAIPTKSGALGLCSAFDYNVGSHVSGADDIIIHQSSLYPIVYTKTVYADASAFKTAMSGQYLIYELATVTLQTLTASQVQSLLALQTFKSHTDIVADCTVDVEYYKDNANGQSVADVDSKIGLVQNEIDAFAKPIALTSLLGSGSEAVYIKIGNVVTLSGKYIKNSDSWSLFNGAPIPKYNASSASKVLGKAYSEDGTVAVDLYQAKNGTIQEHTNETRTVAVYFNITYICE